MKGLAEPQSEAVIEEDRVEPSRKRNKCMFTMAQTRLVINQLLLISGGSYLPHYAAQTQCFSLPFRTTFSPLKWPTCSSPWPACTCPGMTPLTQNTYTILPCETLNIHHTCMSFMIMLTWHHDIPLHGTPSFTILLFTYILIPKIAFFKCGSIQNVARVSGSGQVFNLRPGQQSLLHV